MTIPTGNYSSDNNNNPENNGNNSAKSINTPKSSSEADGENIYQPIWQFKTVGTDQTKQHKEYLDITDEYEEISQQSTTRPMHDRDANFISEHIDDHGEWETDDEFMFSTGQQNSSEPLIKESHTNTLRSNCSDFSVLTSSSLDNDPNCNSYVFRTICLFYSPLEPNLKAVKYDYDRSKAWKYFSNPLITKAKFFSNISASPLKKNQFPHKYVVSPDLLNTSDLKMAVHNVQQQKHTNPSNSEQTRKVNTFSILPDSVQAWKFMLLDIQYLEDEEDMVS